MDVNLTKMRNFEASPQCLVPRIELFWTVTSDIVGFYSI